jgi:hypothetical protein
MNLLVIFFRLTILPLFFLVLSILILPIAISLCKCVEVHQ